MPRPTTVVLFASLSLLACHAPPATARPAHPNIVLIVADDHAAHALSCYGSAINRTPALDRLAAEGMRVDRAFVTNALCGPSRACILTGKYSHANGMIENERPFDGSQWTVQRALQQQGYATAAIGKWHLGSTPTGFDWHDVLPGQGVYRDPAFLTMGQRTTTKGYVTDLITDKAIAWLAQQRADQPFFLFVGHKAPHRPWQPDDKHATLYSDPIAEPATLFDDYAGRAAASEATMRVARDFTETDTKQPVPAGLSGAALTRWYYQRYMQDYLRVVQSLDDNVGRLLAWLDAHGHRDDTLVIYTSDNGFFLGDHGFYDKRFAYEESLRVPLIARWPGVIAPGSTSDRMTLNVDFAPTFLAAAGAPVPANLHGRDLWPVLTRSAEPWREAVYYRYYEYPEPHRVRPHVAVRSATHKLLWFPDLASGELFDLTNDPHELQNRWDDPACATVRAQLLIELQRLQQQVGDAPTVPPPPVR